jgi:hypothetical protein
MGAGAVVGTLAVGGGAVALALFGNARGWWKIPNPFGPPAAPVVILVQPAIAQQAAAPRYGLRFNQEGQLAGDLGVNSRVPGAAADSSRFAYAPSPVAQPIDMGEILRQQRESGGSGATSQQNNSVLRRLLDVRAH